MSAEWSMEWNGEWSIFGLFASVFAILLFARQFLYHWLQVGALSHKLKPTRSSVQCESKCWREVQSRRWQFILKVNSNGNGFYL